MKRKNFVRLSCAEAAEVCNKTEYKEANFKDKLKLILHLFFCKTCDHYYKENQKLSGLIKKADLKFCTPEEKEAYRQRIAEKNLEALKNQQDN
jgi:hypothetical protein